MSKSRMHRVENIKNILLVILFTAIPFRLEVELVSGVKLRAVTAVSSYVGQLMLSKNYPP